MEIGNSNVVDDHLYYKYKLLRFVKKCGVDFTYSTSKDLKKDFLVIENVPEIIKDLEELPC